MCFEKLKLVKTSTTSLKNVLKAHVPIWKKEVYDGEAAAAWKENPDWARGGAGKSTAPHAHVAQACARSRTSFALHAEQRCSARNLLMSWRDQKGIVSQRHVRKFQMSRTAFIVMPYSVARAAEVESRAVREALAL